jgi:hypothetical protein
VPNHLSLIGQERAKNLVLSYINKKGWQDQFFVIL